MTICDRKLSDPFSHWHERSVAVACLVSLDASGAINGTQLAQNLELPTSSVTAITLPLSVDRVEHNLCVVMR